MRYMATQHLRLAKAADGYYRTQWIDERGDKHRRSFGCVRGIALNDFASFRGKWQSDPRVRNPWMAQRLTVRDAWALFSKHADSYYIGPDGKPTGEAKNIEKAFKRVVEIFGDTLADEFGPMRLAKVREAMVVAKICRNVINQRVQKIRHVFKWLASTELVSVTVWHGLQALPALQAGRAVDVCGVSIVPEESEPVTPVPDEWVWRVCAVLPPSLAAMVKFQYWTGCRPQDVCNLVPVDVDTTGKVWLFRPAHHKTRYAGKVRTVIVGPCGQEALRPYLERQTCLNATVFSPKLSVAERREARVASYVPPESAEGDYRTWPSYQKRRAASSLLSVGDRWASSAYAHAIRGACEVAKVPTWSPNRLRHNAGTRLRKGFGLDVAQVVLGHSNADVTQIYAEVDLQRAIAAMEQVG